MDHLFEQIADRIATAMGKPLTFVACYMLVLVWAATGPICHFSDTWQLVINTGTTIITFLMVFIIQNSQNREGQALQAKLDELIRALDKAENRFIALEKRPEHEITEMREACKAEATTDAPAISAVGGNPTLTALSS